MLLDCWTRNLLKVEHFLSSIFRAWGVFVANRPLLVIIVATIFGAVCSVFIAFMEEETDTRYLYAAEGTQSWRNYDRYMDTWGNYDPVQRSSVMIVTSNGDNAYTYETLSQLLQIHELIANLTVEDGGESLKFADICSKTYSNNDNCLIQCALEFFDFNDTRIEQTISYTNSLGSSGNDLNFGRIVTYPVQLSAWSQEFESLATRMGSPVTTFPYNLSSGSSAIGFDVVSETPAFQCTYVTDGDNIDEELLLEWEDAWIELLEKVTDRLGISDDLDVTYLAAKSFEDELTRAVASDVSSFILTFNILCTLSIVFVLRFRNHGGWGCSECCKCEIDPTRSRSLVAITGVLSAVLAVGACFGLTGGVFGVKFNGVASVSPFLLLGLGVDDMFVLLRSYELTSPLLSVEERIALTMERGGVSIMFTSITDLIAFSIGSTSPFGAISAFCAFCALGVLFDFLFQVTIFLGFMVYDSRWNATVPEDFRWPNCLCGCCKDSKTCGSIKKVDAAAATDTSGGATSGNAGNEAKADVELAAMQRGEQGGAQTRSSQSDAASSSKSAIGHLIDEQASSQLMEKLGELILKDRRVSFCILAVFAGYVAGGVYGITTLISYEDPVDLAPNDSYLRPFYSDAEDYFSEVGPAMMFGFDKDLDYSDKYVQNLVSNFTKEVEEYRCFGFPSLTQNWLQSYVSWIEANNVTFADTTDWYYKLYSEFLNTEEGSIYIDDIWETVILDNVEHTYDTTVDGLSYVEVEGSGSGSGNGTGSQPQYQINVDYDEFAANIGSSIRRTRIWIQLFSIGYGSEILAECMEFLQDVTADYKKELGSYYSFEGTQYAETSEVALEQTIFNVTLASAAAFLMCLLLIPYPSVSVFVAYAVGQILVGVLGYMSLWDISINTTSMINIVISVGFSVDNTAHFCHAYMIAPIQKNIKGGGYLKDPRIANNPGMLERHQRCLFALNSVGLPILAGDLSTVCALLPLAAAQSAIFTTFFKILFLVMLFGAAHAIFFLPVLFSFIGPINVGEVEDEQDDRGHAASTTETAAKNAVQNAEKKAPLNKENYHD